MKNPCYTCIVQAGCTKICNEKEEFTSFIFKTISTLHRGFSLKEMEYWQKLKHNTLDEEWTITCRSL